MEILRVYLRIPPERGGMENHIKRLTEEQLILGHNVTLGFNKGEKVSVHDHQLLKRIALINLPFGIGIFLFHSLLLIYLFFKRSKFDVCHIHGDWHSLLFAPIYRLITKGNITFSFHGAFETRFISHRIFLTRLLKLADLVLINGMESFKCLRSFHRNIFCRSSGVENLFYTINCIKNKSDKQFNVITIANLNRVKNLDSVIDTANGLPNFSFYIYGEGEQRSQLEGKIDKLKLNNVKICGHKNRFELVEALGLADAFLLTSFKEGTPTVVLEAMAARVPVIASNAGGLVDLLPDQTVDVILDPVDIEGYINALTKLYNNDELRIKRIEKAYEFSLSCSWENVAKEITAYMEKIV